MVCFDKYGLEFSEDKKTLVRCLQFDAFDETTYNVKIPYGVRYIGDSAFEKCKGLKTVRIPKSVKIIRDGALTAFRGEIIVGKQLLSGVVTESQPIYDRLYERLKKAFQRGTPVRLTIRG